MNLVIALLSTRQFVPADKIRATVAGYEDSTSDEAFGRMFERDKNELRDLGIPLQVGPAPGEGNREGYRIDRAAYELPEIDLTRAEAAAVAVAARLWESPELANAADGALLKLRAAGVHVGPQPAVVAVPALPAHARGSETTLSKLLAAVDAGRAVRFSHRSVPTAPAVQRDVQPWGVITYRGRWYLVGFDVDRAAVRTFRLSRIGDDVVAYGRTDAVRKPPEADLRAIVAAATDVAPVTGSATVWVADGRGQELRRLGVQVEARTVGGRVGALVEVPVRSWKWLARLITGLGADALVVAPEQLRDEVIARLRSVADRTGIRAS